MNTRPDAKGYQSLEVWQLAISLAKDVYRLTKELPASEQFGLVSQLRRAAVSVPANIAEGYGRNQSGSYVQFLRIAKGSLNEVETLLILTDELELAVPGESLMKAIATLGSKLSNLVGKVQANVIKEERATYLPNQPN